MPFVFRRSGAIERGSLVRGVQCFSVMVSKLRFAFLLFLLALVAPLAAPAAGDRCFDYVSEITRLAEGSRSKSATVRALSQIETLAPTGWKLPKPGTKAFEQYAERLSPAMRRELLDTGSWKTGGTEVARVAIPVARMTEAELAAIARPRRHLALPAFAKDGSHKFPEYVRMDNGRPEASETFHVRMMAIKEAGKDGFELPPQLEYLRPFIQRAFELERERDPSNFKNRLAFVQVDASWVEPGQLQPRPGRVTEQVADKRDRKGAHVDGFMVSKFHELQEDVTYSLSTGFDSANGAKGDAIPTEFFERGFPLPRGINHTDARPLFDRMANQVDPIYMPNGFINRMSSRVVHRVGVAKKRTYRTFVKVKFTDEVFHQAQNTVNGVFVRDARGDVFFVPSEIYARWQRQGIPLVERATLPTEGVVDAADRDLFQTRGRIGAP